MKNSLLFTALFISHFFYGQISPSDVTLPTNSIEMNLGSNKYINWFTSNYGGYYFGHRIINTDPGGQTLLKFQFKHGSTTPNWTSAMSITSKGNIGIGTENPDELLTVNGIIHCKEVLVDMNIFPDYVFQSYYSGKSSIKPDYKMLTLEEIEAFTKTNFHLPEIPSAEVVSENGLGLKEMTVLLLQKVEELTLYTIEQEKRIKTLESSLASKQ